MPKSLSFTKGCQLARVLSKLLRFLTFKSSPDAAQNAGTKKSRGGAKSDRQHLQIELKSGSGFYEALFQLLFNGRRIPISKCDIGNPLLRWCFRPFYFQYLNVGSHCFDFPVKFLRWIRAVDHPYSEFTVFDPGGSQHRNLLIALKLGR